MHRRTRGNDSSVVRSPAGIAHMSWLRCLLAFWLYAVPSLCIGFGGRELCFAQSLAEPTASAAGADDDSSSEVRSAPRAGEPSRESVAADGVRVETNICFAEHDGEQLLCDVYLPARPPGEPRGTRRPAVVVVHGGAWVSGDKWAIGVYARRLADAGFVAVSINYRLAPKHKFPAQVDDVRSALVWLVESADKYGVDPQRIGMLGYSAGAHLSCMIGTLMDAEWDQIATTTMWPRDDPRWAKLPKVCGVVGGGTPCDFTGLPSDNQSLAYFLGGTRGQVPEAYRAASPVSHASPGDAAILLIHGTRDLLVPIASSRQLYDLHKRLGIASQFVALEGFGHMLTFLHPETRSRAVQFLSEHLSAARQPGELAE